MFLIWGRNGGVGGGCDGQGRRGGDSRELLVGKRGEKGYMR